MRKLERYTEGKPYEVASQLLRRPSYCEINYYKRMAWWGRPVHEHSNMYQFLLVTRGYAIVEVEGERYELGTGDVSIVAPDVAHRIYTDKGYEQVGMNVDCTEIHDDAGLMQLLHTYAKPFLFLHCPEMLPRADELIKLLTTESLFTAAAASLLASQMVLEALEKHAFSQEKRFDIELSRHLSDHLGDKLTLKTIAEHFHISVPQLERETKKYFGMGAIALYNQKRYVYAVGQLRQTEWSMSEIAQSVGFDDVSNFSAFISKRSGISPSMHRKQIEWHYMKNEIQTRQEEQE